MKRILVSLCMVGLVGVSQAWGATVTLNLTWSVTNTPTVSATHYRVDELVSEAWVARATVPASQLTYSIPGRAVDQTYSFSIVPLNGTVEGVRSKVSVCGTMAAPDATLTFSCTPTVVP